MTPSVGGPAVTQGALRAIFSRARLGALCLIETSNVCGLVTRGGSQLPLPWSKGTPCC